MGFMLLFLFFSLLGSVPGVYFREHYFVLLLPAFALLVGLAFASLQSMPSRWMKTVPAVLLAGVIVWDVYLQSRAFFQLSPQIICRIFYRVNPFVESVLAAKYVREHSSTR